MILANERQNTCNGVSWHVVRTEFKCKVAKTKYLDRLKYKRLKIKNGITRQALYIRGVWKDKGQLVALRKIRLDGFEEPCHHSSGKAIAPDDFGAIVRTF